MYYEKTQGITVFTIFLLFVYSLYLAWTLKMRMNLFQNPFLFRFKKFKKIRNSDEKITSLILLHLTT